jgi:arginine/lysine/ornithine decarboxylase
MHTKMRTVKEETAGSPIVFWSESERLAKALESVLKVIGIPNHPCKSRGMLIEKCKGNGPVKLLYLGGNEEIVREDTSSIAASHRLLWCPLKWDDEVECSSLWKTRQSRLITSLLQLHHWAVTQIIQKVNIQSDIMNHETVEEEVRRVLGAYPKRPKRMVLSDIIHLLQNEIRDSEKNNDPTKALDVVSVAIQFAMVKQIGDVTGLQELAGYIKSGAWDSAILLAVQIYSGRRGASTKDTSQLIFAPRQVSEQPLPEIVVLFVDDRKEEFGWFKREVAANSNENLPYRLTVECCEYESPSQVEMQLRDEPSCQVLVVDWNLAEDTKGDQLIKTLRTRYPNLLYCILTREDPLSLLGKYRFPQGVRAFQKRDPTAIASLYQHVVDSIRKRASTPFFTALKEYSQRPVSVFHAQITSGGKSLRKSTWLGDFYDFYGKDVFNGETTTTLAPLDSLLEPKGTIKQAQDLAAKAFGAERTFFVTNGTSTAVKILYQALLKPGDTVLIDRCCHKSHHYGLVLAGANPAYLSSDPLNLKSEDGTEYGTGIWKGVTTKKILDTLESNPDAKMLSLTNCTFDGYIHKTESIVRQVLDKLDALKTKGIRKADSDDFVFLFDEAWFAYAAFLPETRELTAMAVAQKVSQDRVVRFYSVQSTHKTLTAFRQGSMIHSRDPYLNDPSKNVGHELQESLFTHTTTSPSYNMIASLDVGRMQADLEGRALWGEAWSLAADLRETINNDVVLQKYFEALTPEKLACADLMPRNRGSESNSPGNDKTSQKTDDGDEPMWYLDTSKVTLLLKPDSGLTGELAKKLLLDQHDIHFNKSTSNSCLLMVNGGSTSSSVSHLVQALRDLVETSASRSKRTRLPTIIERELLDVTFATQDGKPLSIRESFFGGPWASANECQGVYAIEDELTKELVDAGRLVSRFFVIPYPPGFPLLVPGQVVTPKVLEYLRNLDVSEIHGMKEGLVAVRVDAS